MGVLDDLMQTLREAAEEAKRQAQDAQNTQPVQPQPRRPAAPSPQQKNTRQADHPSADDVVIRDENGRILVREGQLRQPKAGPVVREAQNERRDRQQRKAAAEKQRLERQAASQAAQKQTDSDREKRRLAQERQQRKLEREQKERQEKLEQLRQQQRRQPKQVTAAGLRGLLRNPRHQHTAVVLAEVLGPPKAMQRQRRW
jgi:hypothetical protein